MRTLDAADILLYTYIQVIIFIAEYRYRHHSEHFRPYLLFTHDSDSFSDMARRFFVSSNKNLIFQAEKSENEDDVVFGEINSIDTPQSAKSRKSARSIRSTTSPSARSVKSSKSVASAHIDAVNDGDQIGSVQVDDEDRTGVENVDGFDGVVENSDILIINHGDDNADNNSSDDIEAGSGSVDYDDSFLRNKSANSNESEGKRNASANNNEAVVEGNEAVTESLNNETNDAIEVEQGVEAIESIVEWDQASHDPGEDETLPSLPASAASRISVRSIEKAEAASFTTSPRSGKETSPPLSARSQLQSAKSHRSNRSASARSQTGSLINQPTSTSQTPLQGSASSQVSRHTMNETHGSATSRKSAVNSAKSGKMSAHSLPGSARSRGSNAEGSAKSRTTVITNENATENAEEGGDLIGNEDVTVPSDEINAEADAETENKNDIENYENLEPDIELENTTDASANDIETPEEVTLLSLANFHCVANRNMPAP